MLDMPQECSRGYKEIHVNVVTRSKNDNERKEAKRSNGAQKSCAHSICHDSLHNPFPKVSANRFTGAAS